MRPSGRLIPVLLIVVGSVIAVAALGADYVGLGDGGMGLLQWTLLAAGGLSIVAGIALLTSGGVAWANGWARYVQDSRTRASVFLLAAFFGLISGWGQVGVQFVRRNFRHEIIGMGLDYAWLIPATSLMMFLLLGLALYLANRQWPKRVGQSVIIGTLAFVAFFSLLLLVRHIHKAALAVLALGLAVQVARIAARRPKEFGSTVRFTIGWPALLRRPPTQSRAAELMPPTRRDFVIGASTAVAAIAVGVRSREAIREHRSLTRIPVISKQYPNVLLVVMDTVRAANLGLHGYAQPTSPNLERLAARGLAFEHAIAPASWTLPSHASMFTGRWPHELSTGPWSALDATYPTLAEYLRDFGYRTTGFIANREYCSHEFGLSRGFVHYEDYRMTPGQAFLYTSLGQTAMQDLPLAERLHTYDNFGRKSAEQLTDDFLRWHNRNAKLGPFFGFLNYWDAHDPYTPPKDFAARFAPPHTHGGTPLTEPPDPEILAALMGHYDASIAYVDNQIGVLVDELDRRGVLEHTLMIVLSDHGEHFGEHGLMLHGGSLYAQEIHVPLLLLYQGLAHGGSRVDSPVSLRNLAATIVDIADLGRDAPFPGSSLLRALEDGLWADPVASEADRVMHLSDRYPAAKGRLASLVQGDLHYIWREFDSGEELYRLDVDPTESDDLAQSLEMSDDLQAMRGALQSALST